MGRIAIESARLDESALLPAADYDPSGEKRLLKAEVEDLRRIHALSLRLAAAETLPEVLIEVLRTAAQLVDARLGSVQLLTPDGKLGMVGEVGFGSGIVEQFSLVSLEDCTTCALALRRRSRVAVRNLSEDPDFADIATALRSHGAVGAVSTPVLDRSGSVLAMFSLYWPQAHDLDDREIRALDLCAELAGRHVERSIAARLLRDRERRQVLLMRELAHRGKNLLSVVQAIASRTLRGDQSLEHVREVFIGRLGALGNTYNTLTDDAPESAQLHEIVSASLKSFSERADVCGPAIVVPANRAQTLSLVVHELATNAAKYGALSVATGRVAVGWGLVTSDTDGERFVFEWAESGGPSVQAPARQGFGSLITTVIVGRELNCVPVLEYARDGFRYRLECAVRSLTAHAA